MYKRHIVIDNIRKLIQIEVQTDLNYYPKMKEYADINNGLCLNYVPLDLRAQIRDLITNGYQVQPVLIMGLVDREYYVVQVAAFELQKVSTESKLIKK